jgi:hypothetical protein
MFLRWRWIPSYRIFIGTTAAARGFRFSIMRWPASLRLMRMAFALRWASGMARTLQILDGDAYGVAADPSEVHSGRPVVNLPRGRYEKFADIG